VFQTILVGIDGSATARIAEDTATMLARALGGQLLIVSAYHGKAEARTLAERTVEESHRRVKAAGVDAWSEVAEGEPATAIVELADRVDAELIVIGDLGMGQGRRLRLGGISDRISHSAPCNVLIVRTAMRDREADGPQPGSARYESVLIATDGSPTAAHAAHLGVELSKGLGASVTLVHVGDELMGRIILKDAAERLGEPELPQRLATGDPGRTIARLAAGERSDLVVVGNKGIAGARRVLGSVPNTISHAAGCDVLIVHTVGRSVADVKPGEGAIVEEKGRKLAGYRELSGQVITLSKKCTHLGCSVQWNPSLQTWDCPCHGSRYDARGKVIQGPAQRDLEVIEI
jgi:nucleotide-binding universal stress UspA family protein